MAGDHPTMPLAGDLMPAGLVRRDHLDNGLNVSQLASRYKVSSEAMGIRISVLGLAQ